MRRSVPGFHSLRPSSQLSSRSAAVAYCARSLVPRLTNSTTPWNARSDAAAAVALPSFEGVIEFVSLGTNDLAQYAAGADRELSWPDDLREWNPGTLRLIQRALLDARTLGLEAGACGELAGSPAGAVLLAGLGATSLSMSAGSLEAVAQALRALSRDGCVAAAQAALAERTAAGARSAVETHLPAPLSADFT